MPHYSAITLKPFDLSDSRRLLRLLSSTLPFCEPCEPDFSLLYRFLLSVESRLPLKRLVVHFSSDFDSSQRDRLQLEYRDSSRYREWSYRVYASFIEFSSRSVGRRSFGLVVEGDTANSFRGRIDELQVASNRTASNLAVVVDSGVTAGSDVPSVSPPTSATFHRLEEDAPVSTSAFVIGKGTRRSDGRVERGEPRSGKLPTAVRKFDC